MDEIKARLVFLIITLLSIFLILAFVMDISSCASCPLFFLAVVLIYIFAIALLLGFIIYNLNKIYNK